MAHRRPQSQTISTRTHKCPHCNFVADRDENAAINILQKGLSTAGHAGSKAGGEDTSTQIGEILSEQVDSLNL